MMLYIYSACLQTRFLFFAFIRNPRAIILVYASADWKFVIVSIISSTGAETLMKKGPGRNCENAIFVISPASSKIPQSPADLCLV
jgi:hypothetical protein